MAGRELFVWYRVRRERAGEARAAVVAMQRSLAAQWPALQARLLVRDDGGLATWMESYSSGATDAAPTGIDADIEAAIAAAARALAGLIEGERHVEAFEAAT
jgi:hypothetical protein